MEILNYLQMHSVRRAEFVLKRSHPRSRIISNRKRFSVSAIISLGLLFLGCGGVATAQIQPGQLMQPAPAATASLTPPINTDYEPITIEGRMRWWVKATVGPTSLIEGVFSSGIRTALAHPPKWGTGWSGFGKRYALRLSGVGLSNAMEGTIGAEWGEDPRYFRAGQGPFGSRVKHVIAGGFMDRYRDGTYGPAVARFIAIPASNFIADNWRPAGETSTHDTVLRIGMGFASKLGSNAFKEFWPDIKDKLFHRK